MNSTKWILHVGFNLYPYKFMPNFVPIATDQRHSSSISSYFSPPILSRRWQFLSFSLSLSRSSNRESLSARSIRIVAARSNFSIKVREMVEHPRRYIFTAEIVRVGQDARQSWNFIRSEIADISSADNAEINQIFHGFRHAL